MKPLVSICIPTYNREDLVRNAIKCAQNQTYKNIEIVISDDASTDKTIKVLKKIKDKKIRLFRQKKNLGMVKNWNFCVKKAKGKYIKFIASDDLIDEDCVEKEVALMEKHKKLSLVVCKRRFIDQNGRLMYTLQFSDKSTRVSGKKHAKEVLTTLRENKMGEPSAALFRRKDAIKVGLFDKQFSQYADFEFWIRLLMVGDLGYINKKLCSFMVHSGSNTTAAMKDGRYIDETFHIINKYFDSEKYASKLHLTDSDKEKVVKTKTLDFIKTIKDFFIAGRPLWAREHFRRLSKFVKISDLALVSVKHLLN